MSSADYPAPLEGVRVLDLATGAAGAIGRSLAELGADVVRVEERGGSSDREFGPTVAGVGLAFAAANVGKHGIALDFALEADRSTLEELARTADIVIETTKPGSKAQAQLDAAGLAARNPSLIVLSLPDFGKGPLAGWIASDGVVQALSGELSRSGRPGRPPLLPPGELAIECASAQAVYALLVALVSKRQTGTGDHLDLSLLDGAMQALDPGFGMGGSATSGVPASQMPRGRPDASHMYPVLKAKDGYVRLCILAQRQWQGMFQWMGEPEAFADPSFNDMRKRFSTPALHEAMRAFIAGKTQAEVEAESPRYRVPAAAVATLEGVLASEHLAARDALRDVALSENRTIRLPNGVTLIDGRRAAAKPELPDKDGDACALLAEWSAPRRFTRISQFGQPGRPLAGIRVLDLGVIVVGAEQGRLLADYGAEVIKIESADFPDGARASSPGGMSPGFASGHRNKLGLGLDLRSEQGRELFLKLVEKSDVVLSNFKPGTLESLGLSQATLFARNPQIITVESSAYGEGGPWSDRMGYGPLVRASAGLTSLWRYPEDEESFSDTVTIYPDHVAARISISAVLGLLLRRSQTGKGGAISVSQMEVMLSQLAPQVAEAALRQGGEAVDGHPVRDTPWGVYPCLGDDEWCVVTVRDGKEWEALCRALARPDLLSDPALADASGRAQQCERIDQILSAWTAWHTPSEAAAFLQTAGVPAAPMMRVAQLPETDYFQSRPMFGQFRQPGLEEPVMVDNLPVRSRGLSRPLLNPAPFMGADTKKIAAELLGLGDREYEELVASGVLQPGKCSGAEV